MRIKFRSSTLSLTKIVMGIIAYLAALKEVTMFKGYSTRRQRNTSWNHNRKVDKYRTVRTHRRNKIKNGDYLFKRNLDKTILMERPKMLNDKRWDIKALMEDIFNEPIDPNENNAKEEIPEEAFLPDYKERVLTILNKKLANQSEENNDE